MLISKQNQITKIIFNRFRYWVIHFIHFFEQWRMYNEWVANTLSKTVCDLHGRFFTGRISWQPVWCCLQCVIAHEASENLLSQIIFNPNAHFQWLHNNTRRAAFKLHPETNTWTTHSHMHQHGAHFTNHRPILAYFAQNAWMGMSGRTMGLQNNAIANKTSQIMG